MATILVLTLGASGAMAGGWGGCGMWGGPVNGPYTAAGSYNCPMLGGPGNYYCPMTGTGYCPVVAPDQHTQYADTIDASGQYYSYPAANYRGWGCW
ncbi:MAG: hypothetical protein M1438_08065 [Deltaproteobacteria bacterium]|nr:hypothetical protein [Deltaproteobacteria bacterium]